MFTRTPSTCVRVVVVARRHAMLVVVSNAFETNRMEMSPV